MSDRLQLFASEEEQASILKSVEDSLSDATPFQKKQYERTIAHLKDDKSANLQLVFIAHNLGVDGYADQSKLFPPSSQASQCQSPQPYACNIRSAVARSISRPPMSTTTQLSTLLC